MGWVWLRDHTKGGKADHAVYAWNVTVKEQHTVLFGSVDAEQCYEYATAVLVTSLNRQTFQ